MWITNILSEESINLDGCFHIYPRLYGDRMFLCFKYANRMVEMNFKKNSKARDTFYQIVKERLNIEQIDPTQELIKI